MARYLSRNQENKQQAQNSARTRIQTRKATGWTQACISERQSRHQTCSGLVLPLLGLLVVLFLLLAAEQLGWAPGVRLGERTKRPGGALGRGEERGTARLTPRMPGTSAWKQSPGLLVCVFTSCASCFFSSPLGSPWCAGTGAAPAVSAAFGAAAASGSFFTGAGSSALTGAGAASGSAAAWGAGASSTANGSAGSWAAVVPASTSSPPSSSLGPLASNASGTASAAAAPALPPFFCAAEATDPPKCTDQGVSADLRAVGAAWQHGTRLAGHWLCLCAETGLATEPGTP